MCVSLVSNTLSNGLIILYLNLHGTQYLFYLMLQTFFISFYLTEGGILSNKGSDVRLYSDKSYNILSNNRICIKF